LAKEASKAKEKLMLRRDVRYQAAIVHDDHVLLLKVVDIDSGAMFWLLPGGGREADETEEACIQREVREETELEVTVVRPLFEMPYHPGGIYNRLRTYLCHVASGEARPGIEPEVDTAAHRTIREVGWFDLYAPTTWNELVRGDPITMPLLHQVRVALGYASDEA
jgi:8-oxo-dGTP pyrophosphatase MutT (NUDIX family)